MIDHEFTILKNILDQSGCDKKQVAAGGYVTPNGGVRKWFNATNSCEHDGVICPRLAMQTGVGYELCHSKHAEIGLIDKFKEYISLFDDYCFVDTVWIIGHYYACEPCARALKGLGVEEIRIREL